jgi:hypothetical protein
MSKFKPGDLVVIVRSDYQDVTENIGKIFKVDYVISGGVYCSYEEQEELGLWDNYYFDNEVELVFTI